jgi:Reverse transcriptase (RNA-dependent DNA polymerase).
MEKEDNPANARIGIDIGKSNTTTGNKLVASCKYVTNDKDLGNEYTCNDDRAQTVKSLLRLEHLNIEEKDSIDKLLEEFAGDFHIPGEILGATDVLQHRIPTTDNTPICARQYRFPPIHKEEINRQVNELLEGGIITDSQSPYNTPIWIVPKKPDSQGNKRWRLVLDFRALNEKTIGDSYPLPNITDILDQLGGAKYFSTFDLASGFHQIKMSTEADIKQHSQHHTDITNLTECHLD